MEPTQDEDQSSRHPGKISAECYIQRLKDAQQFAQAAMASVQQRYESNANRSRHQPQKFKVGDKVWLDLRNIKTPQLSKKLSWQHAKYEVTAVPDSLTVELNLPGNIHNRVHVDLIKRAGDDSFPSQIRDDAQNPPLIDNQEDPEYEFESIIRARTVNRWRGKFRQALVKWVGWIDPTWKTIKFIKIYGSIRYF